VIPIQSNSTEDNNDTVLDFDNAAPQESPSQQVSAGTLSSEEAQKIKQAAAILFKRLIEIFRVKLQLLPEKGKLEYRQILFIDNFLPLPIISITVIY